VKCTPGRALVRHRPMTASSDELIRNLIQGRSQTRRSRLTVNFAESGPSAAIATSGQRMNSMASSRIPYATEQGISKRVSGNFFEEQGILKVG
jgi:hypothetical protein